MNHLQPVDRLEIVILVDNSVCHKQTTAPVVSPASEWMNLPEGIEPNLRSGHGLALLVKTEVDDKAHQVLYDTGPSKELLLHNASELGIDLEQIDAIAVSHGHWDHMGGLLGAIETIGKPDIPVYVHEAMFRKRGVERKFLFWKRNREFSRVPTEQEIESAGGRLVYSPNPTPLADSTLVTGGEIPRTTFYEKGFPGHRAFINSEWVEDEDVIDDSCLVAHVRERGIVIMAGCSHAGVVNITRHAASITEENEILNILGGFHLEGKNEDRIDPTISDLQKHRPQYITPIHCTGSKAQKEMQSSFGDRYIRGCVGDRFVFDA